jgi:hypothetical protein
MIKNDLIIVFGCIFKNESYYRSFKFNLKNLLQQFNSKQVLSLHLKMYNLIKEKN